MARSSTPTDDDQRYDVDYAKVQNLEGRHLSPQVLGLS